MAHFETRPDVTNQFFWHAKVTSQYVKFLTWHEVEIYISDITCEMKTIDGFIDLAT